MNIETIIKNPTSFSIYVEREAKKSNTTLFDMLLSTCEKFNIEFDSVQKLMSGSLKEKIYNEALELNLLKDKKTINTLEKFL
jgi:hypothetical protein